MILGGSIGQSRGQQQTGCACQHRSCGSSLDHLWRAAHQKLAARREQSGCTLGVDRRGQHDRESRYLLTSFARCAQCGGSIVAHSRSHGAQRVYLYGCLTFWKKGASKCANNLAGRMDAIRKPGARRQLHLPVVLPQLKMLPVSDLVVRGVLKSQRRSADRRGGALRDLGTLAASHGRCRGRMSAATTSPVALCRRTPATRRPRTVTRRRVAARRRVATPGPGVERCAVDHRGRRRGVHPAGARRALDRCGRARPRARRVHTARRSRTDPCASANHARVWACGDGWRGPRRVARPSPILRERHPGSPPHEAKCVV